MASSSLLKPCTLEIKVTGLRILHKINPGISFLQKPEIRISRLFYCIFLRWQSSFVFATPAFRQIYPQGKTLSAKDFFEGLCLKFENLFISLYYLLFFCLDNHW